MIAVSGSIPARMLPKGVSENVIPISSRSQFAFSCLDTSSTRCSSNAGSGMSTESPKRSNMVVWPLSRRCASWVARPRIRSMPASSVPLLASRTSIAPTLIRLSRMRLLMPFNSILRQKSSRLAKGSPASLDSTTRPIAASPTFLMAPRPKRMLCVSPGAPSITNCTLLWFTSGGRISISMRWHSAMVPAIFSMFPSRWLRTAVMYSTGKLALKYAVQ